MYIEDCLNSIIQYMLVPEKKLKLRTYNVHAMSFTPEELVEEIKKHVPHMTISYKPDSRQQIGKASKYILHLSVGFFFLGGGDIQIIITNSALLISLSNNLYNLPVTP